MDGALSLGVSANTVSSLRGLRLAAPVADAALDARFVMLWEQIAAHFQERDQHLVFELYNEPHGRLNGEAWLELAARVGCGAEDESWSRRRHRSNFLEQRQRPAAEFPDTNAAAACNSVSSGSQTINFTSGSSSTGAGSVNYNFLPGQN